MAQTTSPTVSSTAISTGSRTGSPVTEEALLADRQRFWGSFTTATFAAVVFIAVLLVLLAIFLV